MFNLGSTKILILNITIPRFNLKKMVKKILFIPK